MEVAEIGVRIDTNDTHGTKSNTNKVRVRRKTLNSVLEQCNRAIRLLNDTGFLDDDADYDQEYNNADEDEVYFYRYWMYCLSCVCSWIN